MLGIAEGVLQDLHNDHSEVDSLMDRLEESADSATQEAVFEEMKTKLLARAMPNRRCFKPRWRRAKARHRGASLTRAPTNNQTLEKQLQKLSTERDKTSARWAAELKVLRELVEHHVEEEESTGFEKDELEAMAQRFQTRKALLMTRVA